MGSRGSSSGKGKKKGSRVSNTAQTVDIAAIESAIRSKGGEGTFIRSEVPALVRSSDDNGLEIHSEKGYATIVDGVPVFIQGSSKNGYSYNIYGMTASREPMKTLSEAKDTAAIKTLVERAKSANNGIDTMKKVFEAANNEGGITLEEYTRIVRRNRKQA